MYYRFTCTRLYANKSVYSHGLWYQTNLSNFRVSGRLASRCNQIWVKDSIIFNMLLNTIDLFYVIFILHMTACYLGPGYRVVLSGATIYDNTTIRQSISVVLSCYRIVGGDNTIRQRDSMHLSYDHIVVLSYYRIVVLSGATIREYDR